MRKSSCLLLLALSCLGAGAQDGAPGVLQKERRPQYTAQVPGDREREPQESNAELKSVIQAQTAAIRSLAEKVEALESRIRELETKARK